MSKLNRVAAILGQVAIYLKNKGSKLRIHLVIWEVTDEMDNMDHVNEWDITDWFRG